MVSMQQVHCLIQGKLFLCKFKIPVDDVQVTLVRATAGVAEDGGVEVFCATISLQGNTLDTDIEFTLDDMGDGIAGDFYISTVTPFVN